MIPKRERWLYDTGLIESVERGIKQAKAGQVMKVPDEVFDHFIDVCENAPEPNDKLKE